MGKGDIDNYAKQSGTARSPMTDDNEKAELDDFANKIRKGEIDHRLIYENVDTEGVPLDAVQVDVIETNPEGINKFTFFTKADFPDQEVVDNEDE